MTYTDLKKEMLSRIDPAYAENTTYQSMAERAFLNALRTVLLVGAEVDFPGFINKITSSAPTTFNFSAIKTAGLDLIKVIRIVNSTGIQFVEKSISDFYDPIMTNVSAYEMFYCVQNKTIVFKASTTADIYYFGIPTINASDDMGQYLSQAGLEQVLSVALPMLDTVIRGVEWI